LFATFQFAILGIFTTLQSFLATFPQCCQPYVCIPETTQASLDSLLWNLIDIGKQYKELLKHFSSNSDWTILMTTLHED
jgi:hypothetical protein